MLAKEKEKILLKIIENFKSNIKLIKDVEQTEGQYYELPKDIDKSLADFLQSEGLENLYSHQYLSYYNLKEGKNILVTTPTASGKSLCYNLFILDSIIKAKKENKEIKALYIFPTKALTNDQKEKILKINETLNKFSEQFGINIYQYDGDTPSSIRTAIKVKGDIILTNPDMLHTGILPNHTKWVKFFNNLKFVVIDEVHIYKGVFGSHFALLIERLKRIARFYNNEKIQFILLSATISNAKEHAEKLINEDVFLIDKNGAPQKGKKFIFYNPPIIPNTNIRKGIIYETVKIVSSFLNYDFQIINFLPSRLYVELIYNYLLKMSPDKKKFISSYRGGYLPKERKEIEKGLRERKIKYVSSTNALELGVDIGSFDICVISGFPGSISSFFQQAGRAGRKEFGAVIFIASNNPLDQYFMDNLELFFKKSPESPMINPLNKYIFYSHLKCSLFEIPFYKDEKFYNIEVSNFLNQMFSEKIATYEENRYFFSDLSYPSENISLRNSENENFLIVDVTNDKNEIIGNMDRISAFNYLYPHAIYMHIGKIYEVVSLDLENYKAYIKEVKANYYTDSLTKTDIEILRELLNKNINKDGIELLFTFSEVMVNTSVFKFKKLKFFTNENIGFGDVILPPYQFATETFFVGFFNIEKILKKNLKKLEKLNDFQKDEKISIFINYFENESYKKEFISELINSLAYLTKNFLSFYLSCDSKDLGYADFTKSPFYNIPGFFIYDNIVGGINLAREGFNYFPFIFEKFKSRVLNCDCKDGCPSCIGIVDDKNGYKKINKNIIINFLDEIS